MKAKPSSSRTVRIDRASHAALRELARRFAEREKRHYSIADIVRVGITLAARHIEREANAR